MEYSREEFINALSELFRLTNLPEEELDDTVTELANQLLERLGY